MENFTNETIDIATLPKFEEVQFTALHPKYKNVIFINLAILIAILIIVPTIVVFIKPEFFSAELLAVLGISIGLVSVTLIAVSMISFKKKGFAFRDYDVLFKSGVISDRTTIIPYNRVQHVAVHQGFISRKLGLASVEIFTAGGSGSDLEIPGIEKEQAEKIKQLLMSKLTPEVKNNSIFNDGEI